MLIASQSMVYHIMKNVYFVTQKKKAPINCKLAALLFIQGHSWTVDRLAKRGLRHHENCVVCHIEEEDTQHFFLGCEVVIIIWSFVLFWAGTP
jgi:hypothetical protein